MRFSSLFIALAVALACSQAPVQAVAQEAPRVVNVQTYDVAGNTPGFLEFVQRARAISEQYGGTGEVRVFLSTLAGPNTNTVAVVAEFPSLVSLAESNAKIIPSPEWQQLLADFQAAGMRLVSSSVSVDITP